MANPKPDTIRAAVIDAAQRHGWTARELAARAGLQKDAVWRYLTGRADITTDKADAVLRVLGLRIGGGT